MELSANPREHLAVMSVGYITESEGHRHDEPIIQLYCRDDDGERRYIEVEGFYPYFTSQKMSSQSDSRTCLQITGSGTSNRAKM
jgi:hypothetical protein